MRALESDDFLFVSHLPDAATENTCAIVVASEQVLCEGDSGSERVIFSAAEFDALGFAGFNLPEHRHPMGYYNSQPCSAIHLPQPVELPDGLQWRPLRSLLGVLPDAHFNWAGRANQLIDARLNHRFCGRCGAPTQSVPKEHASHCAACKLDFYPRLSPCVIMIVTRGEQCLLARNVRWDSWFSALAGFMEPGETAEQAVRREVLEEVGIRVGAVNYIGSQPWPFPGQLMLGFQAEYESGELNLDEDEIAEANWFSADNLPPHPGTRALSGQLIQYFIDQCG